MKEWLLKQFEWLNKVELVELDEIDTSEDPVRPELDNWFRHQYGRKVYGLKDNNEIVAVMCFAFTNDVPADITELDEFSKDAFKQAIHREGQQGSIAIAYTVWSKKKGGGKKIVHEVYKMIKNSSHLNRLVTLSPKTEMARKFHLRNGARELRVNKTTINYEY
tara:strand:- start:153 stop:641 length:489 start_codon:yes stop_codon:yes gene_type:complete